MNRAKIRSEFWQKRIAMSGGMGNINGPCPKMDLYCILCGKFVTKMVDCSVTKGFVGLHEKCCDEDAINLAILKKN